MSVDINDRTDISGPVELDQLQFDFSELNDGDNSHLSNDTSLKDEQHSLNFLIQQNTNNSLSQNDIDENTSKNESNDQYCENRSEIKIQDRLDIDENQGGADCDSNTSKNESNGQYCENRSEIKNQDGLDIDENQGGADCNSDRRDIPLQQSADANLPDLLLAGSGHHFTGVVYERSDNHDDNFVSANAGDESSIVQEGDIQNPLLESVRSLKEVFIESVPENTHQTADVATKETDNSDSEFEDEYAQQDVVTKSDSESDSEFEVPDFPQGKSGKSVAFQTPYPADGNDSKIIQNENTTPSTLQSVTQVEAISSDYSDRTDQHCESSEKTKDITQQPSLLAPQASSGEPTISRSVPVLEQTQQEPSEKPQIERDPRVKTSDDWENVTTIQAEFAENKSTKTGVAADPVHAPPLLTAVDAVAHFRQSDLSAVKPNVRTSLSRHGFSAIAHFLFGPPKLHRDLQKDRELVFLIAGCQLNNEDDVHVQLLQSIYRILTGSRFNCNRFGSHWEEIGFQGRDPSTDIRGVGMLGLVQLLHFLRDQRSAQIARDVYKLSLHPTQNFPFCVMGMNISRICLQSLREDVMNKECNRRRCVIEVVNEFYAGTYLQLYKIWRQGKTITDSGHVLKEVETFAKKNAKSVFRNMEDYLNQKASRTSDITVEEGQEFLSVCKAEPGE